MFTIEIVQTFCNKNVCIRKKMNFENACFGFQISRAPPSWIIVTCRGRPVVPEQRCLCQNNRATTTRSEIEQKVELAQ